MKKVRQLDYTRLPIEHFGTYEPSLNDIFVSCVGEEQENGGAA